jgi:hypothetical protein
VSIPRAQSQCHFSGKVLPYGVVVPVEQSPPLAITKLGGVPLGIRDVGEHYPVCVRRAVRPGQEFKNFSVSLIIPSVMSRSENGTWSVPGSSTHLAPAARLGVK